MQSLEVAVIVLASVLLIWLLTGEYRSRRGLWSASFLSAALVIAQIDLQGYRWHMIPAYAAIGLALAGFGLARRFRLAAVSFAVLCLAASAVFATVFPVFHLPAPTGSYAIATVTFTLIDHDRVEDVGLGDPRPRELPVQVFYPAGPDQRGQTAFYMPRAETTRLKPQLSLVRTHAVVAARLAAVPAKYPLIIYSPSWGGNRHEATNLVEDLASHGYIVACLDVPGETMVTVFPDGRIVRGNNDPWLDVSSLERFEQTRRFVVQHLNLRVADVRFVLDEFVRLNSNSASGEFHQRIDLARVGVLGFSFGGSTAAQVCRLDPRFKAGVNMDGFSFGLKSDADIPRPFFFMGSGSDHLSPALSSHPSTLYEKLCANDDVHAHRSAHLYGGSILTLRGAEHANFSDQPMYCRWRGYTGAGSINPHRAMSVARTYVLAFFDRQLRGFDEPILQGPSPRFPEVALVAEGQPPRKGNSE